MSQDAREKARQIAAKQSKRGNVAMNRRWIQLPVLGVVVVIVFVIGFVYINGQNNKVPESGPVPASSNEYGGIVLTKDGIVQNSSTRDTRNYKELGDSNASYTPSANGTPQAGKKLPLGVQSADEASKNGKPVRVTIFQDYNCVHCHEFEDQYGEELKKQVQEGNIELEIRNLTFLDQNSPTQYSARTANAAYAVANQVSADKFLDFQKELFSHQGTGDLNNQQIADIASKYGANIGSDMNDNKWRSLVDVVTAESSKNDIGGTPTVFVDGEQYTSNDFTGFLQGKIDAKKNNNNPQQ